MTATNHALTGAAIGLIIGQPILAIPLALVSHFICDAIPHFNSLQAPKQWVKSKTFRNMLITDASLCILLVVILALGHPVHWMLAAVCAFVATSPDLLWINSFVHAKLGKKWRPSRYARFASDIQWFQRPIGAVVEVAWFAALIIVIVPFLR